MAPIQSLGIPVQTIILPYCVKLQGSTFEFDLWRSMLIIYNAITDYYNVYLNNVNYGKYIN